MKKYNKMNNKLDKKNSGFEEKNLVNLNLKQ